MENIAKSDNRLALSVAQEVQRALERTQSQLKRSSLMADIQEARDTAQNGCTNPQGFESVGLGLSQNSQTVAVGDMSSAIPVQQMGGSVRASKQENVLIYAQKNAGLRSLLEIADEIGLLLTLTEEQDSDSLALRKLKRALTRKQLIQVREEVATLHKAAIAEMGNEAWRWA